jgi:hypothetical protein
VEASPEREALVVVADRDAFGRVVDRLRAVASVVHLAPPHLAVVLVDPAHPLAPIDGARLYLDDPPPQDVLDGLDAGGRIFTAAWRARTGGPAKVRPGEGLAWDAPGHLPPDAPTA